MRKIAITCDSTCDLTPELYSRYKIEAVPLGIALGDKSYSDGTDISAQDIFDYAGRTGVLPKTSAIPGTVYEEVFSRYVNDGYDVIHIGISSEMSCCCSNAFMAGQSVGNVFVIDSMNLSTGSGHLAIAARELADSGCSAEEIAAKLEEMKTRLDVSFVLQTLDYLRMGGRCSAVAALGANLLKLRPEIFVDTASGKMTVGRKYRGGTEQTIMQYIRGRLEGRDDIDPGRVFVTHSGLSPELTEKCVSLVKELHPFKEVLVTRAGCTISSHCGPGCIGVLFFRRK